MLTKLYPSSKEEEGWAPECSLSFILIKPLLSIFQYKSSVLGLNSLQFWTAVLVNLSIYVAFQNPGFYIYSVACCENTYLTLTIKAFCFRQKSDPVEEICKATLAFCKGAHGDWHIIILYPEQEIYSSERWQWFLALVQLVLAPAIRWGCSHTQRLVCCMGM